MSKYGNTDDFCKQYNADHLKEMTKQIDQLEAELFSRTYLGVPATPPEIKVGDKVRVCKARWAAEGYPEAEQRYLKEGTVVSIERYLNWYSDQEKTYYIIHFDFGLYRDPVLLKVSYKEIYSHKPKGVNFTYMLNKSCTQATLETETRQEKFDKMLKLSEKLKKQTDAFKKYSDAMYNSLALLGTDIAVTTVDESPFINSHMDVASWYPKFMARSGADFDGDEPNVIGKVDKTESSKDGVKICISQPPRCGKNFFEEIRKMSDKALDFKYKSLPEEAIEQLFPENPVKKPVRDYLSYLEKHPIIPDEIKTIKNGDKTMKPTDLRVKNIIYNGPCTIVFWMDNTKTIVRLKEGDTYDPHAAFCIAVAKKVYGNNSKISRIVDHFSKDVKAPETPPRELSLEELKEAADKLGYRVSRKPKKK